ncbi:MAG TPA: hypothetical protein VEA69_17905 [Tepidisphaeraceae bacterium]|nr:hypothetical protein [Tepidisphaeraceae bacterium]
MIADEQDHLDWIRRWLANRPDADALLAQYRAADDRVARDLTPYFDHLWDVPGLGDEPPTTSEETAPIS